MKGQISRGTSFGMRQWYARTVPRCRNCKKTRLVRHDFRGLGLCAKCQKVLNAHLEWYGGWLCPATKQETDLVFGHRNKPVTHYSECPYCTGDNRAAGERLDAYNNALATELLPPQGNDHSKPDK